MIYLILAIFCSASIALLFKYAAIKSLDQKVLTISNYVIASLIAVYFIAEQQLFTKVDLNDWNFIKSLLIGMGTGIFFLLSFIFYQMSIKQNGASLSGMFAKLGILIPMLVSIFVWQEYPSYVQSIGIFIALGAIVVANSSGTSRGHELHSNVKHGSKILLLMLLFVTGGIGDFLNKVFQMTTDLSYKPIFLLCVFLTALILSIGMNGLRKEPALKRRASWIVGILVGIPNLFASYFLIDALESLPASIVFPVFSAGTILMITVLSVLFYKEKLLKKDMTAILLTAVSLVFMNL